MISTASLCTHSIVVLEGEEVCRECGIVLGYSQVPSSSDWQSHSNLFKHTKFTWLVMKIADNLNLPPYAIQTIVHTSSKIKQYGITQKKSIIFATIYACRVHKIPRLMEDIANEIEKSDGKKIIHSEKSLLKLLNRIAKKTIESGICILSPDKNYYLQAYLSKIQYLVIREAGQDYFELLRNRSALRLDGLKTDPSNAAKKAIIQSTHNLLESKIRQALS